MPIYKDKSRGTWYVSVYVNGKKTTRRGFRTKAEAQREEALLTVGKAHVRMKVITLTDEYLEHKKKRLKESTLHTYTDYKIRFIPHSNSRKVFIHAVFRTLTHSDLCLFLNILESK